MATKAQLLGIMNTELADQQPILARQHRVQVTSMLNELYNAQSRGNVLAGLPLTSLQLANDTFLAFRNGAALQIPFSSIFDDPLTLGTPNGLELDGTVLSLGLASATTTGALSSADFNIFSAKEDAADKGQPNGYAQLDSGAKIPISLIPDSVLGQVEYEGTWDATTNTPTLLTTPDKKGEYYVVSTAGTFVGIDFQVGDWIISNGVEWEKVDNTDAVRTVFGRLGDVVANANDYNVFYVRHDTNAQGLNNTQKGNARTNINAEPTFTKNTGFNKNFGTAANTVTQGNDARLSDARVPLAHTHGNITNAGAIGSVANLVAVTGTNGVLTTASRSGIDTRAAFPPSEHNHDERYYTETELDNGQLDNRYFTEAESNLNFEPKNANIQTHILATDNPHGVTKSQVGLGSVDNTSDVNKPISAATQTALNNKENAFAKNTGFNKNFGTVAGTVAQGNDSRFHAAATLGTANGLSLSGQVLSLGLASATTTGALSATNFSIFNAKVGGSGIAGQVAFWTGLNTLGSSSVLTFIDQTLSIKSSNNPIIELEHEAASDNVRNIINFKGTRSGVGISAQISASRRGLLEFKTQDLPNAGDPPLRWSILSNGIFQSNGSQTIQTSTGNLTLATGGGNGNILLSPNGTGNVGVGTTNPLGKLQIVKDSIFDNEVTSGLRIVTANNSTGLLAGTTASFSYIQSMQPFISFTTRPLILQPNNGNVGIGTTAPSAKLDVQGDLRVATVPNAVGDFITIGTNGILTRRTAAEVLGDIGASTSGGGGSLGGSGTANFVPKFINSTTIGNSSIFDNGNVGIGTNLPSTKLHVQGNLRVTSVSNAVGDYLTIGENGIVTRRTAEEVSEQVGGSAITDNSNVTMQNNTTTNIFNSSQFEKGSYYVTATSDNEIGNSVAGTILLHRLTGTAFTISNIGTNSNITFQTAPSAISGTNLQATQTTGGSQGVIFSVVRITVPIINPNSN